MYTNNVKKSGTQGALVQATSGNVNGSRFGLRGGEDLGGGLQAVFVLENGYNVQNGKLGQNSRLFGRQSYAGLSSQQFGTLTLGRQYDSLVDFVAPLSAFSLGAAYTYTDAHVGGTTTFGADPKWNQLNLQAVYALSLRTDVYAEAMVQHVTGQGYTAFINTAGGASSTGNQVVGTVGLRTRF